MKIFSVKKNNIYIYIYIFYFTQNIDCGHRLDGEAVLSSTHNLCFGAKISINLQIPVFLYKIGV